MAETQAYIKSGYYAYPEAKEGPSAPFSNTPGANPVLRGLPLAVAGSAVANIGLLSGLLWGNAGFSTLRKVDLDGYDPRYDPTVVPIGESGTDIVASIRALGSSYNPSLTSTNRHYSIKDYHSAYEAGTMTPTVVAEALLDLISKSPKHKNAFLEMQKERVIAAAEASTQRYKAGKALGMFDGVPVGVKDTTNNNPAKGTPLNPHNPHYYTGGSSGGSAYTVAAGLFPVTLGADGGGSIRNPSAYCGLYGLKPSHNRVSGTPAASLAPSCGVLGPMASSMADLEYAYRIMAIPNPSDSISSMFPVPVPRSTPQDRVIGIYKPWFDLADASVLNACHAAISHYQSSGYKVIDITIPHLSEGQLAQAVTILSEISAGVPSVSGLTSANKILISVGKHTPASDFLLAQKMRNMLMQHLAFLFEHNPGLLIVTPTTPNAGWHISGGAADLKNGVSDANMSVRTMTYVWLANFSGCPAISIPVGRVDAKEGKGKIPVGLMAMGEWGAEDLLIEWGRVGEQWAWEGGEDRMERPENWVDVMDLARDRQGIGKNGN
ncbi:MAG: hypothetical protein ASARMPRED_009090 [Alectoria sarmentosa]|nr:MAG: hypothetical protein ASARMPRED_009090 [Alectoria sarmentosa]